MNEQYHNPDPTAKIQDLSNFLRDSINTDSEPDVMRNAFQKALLARLQPGNPVHDTIYEALQQRDDLGEGSHFETHIYRTTWYALPEGSTRLDEGDKPATWHDSYRQIFANDAQNARFREGMLHNKLQSNVSDRSKGLAFILGGAALAGRLLEPCSVLDVGTSHGLGLYHLAAPEIPYGTPDIVQPKSNSNYPEEWLKEGFGTFINSLRVPLGPSVGIDIHDRIKNAAWIRANSFNPGELRDSNRVAQFDRLVGIDNPLLEFYQGDYSELDEADFSAAFPDREFDIVHFSTVLYQCSPKQRRAMIAKALEQAREFVIIQDFVRANPQHNRLEFSKNWRKPYSYRTIIADIKNLQRSNGKPYWQEVLQWENGRTMRVRPALGRIALAEGGTTASLWSLFLGTLDPGEMGLYARGLLTAVHQEPINSTDNA